MHRQNDIKKSGWEKLFHTIIMLLFKQSVNWHDCCHLIHTRIPINR